MIKITALSKVYRSKNRKKCHALKNISLTLPDTGLVFVLGKSGSGKSTLLNLIGGLDNLTRGKIEVDGNNLARFNEKDFCNYRNTHIGFIFQDYHLIDELTIYENIVLSLNLRRIEDKDKVKSALEKVDLSGYEDRYPSELSGGERQRIAIARAIVKNPRVILADEPTGNLDTLTSKAILTLLKDLAKECLILIVSHNINDANKYADRIIELKAGVIVSDRTRNPDFVDHVSLRDNTLLYPEGTNLSDADIELINNTRGNNAQMVKRADKFISQKTEDIVGKTHKIENESLSIGREINLSLKFLKSKVLYIAFSSFMVAIIMVIMALSQTIIAFDANRVIVDEMKKGNQDSLLLVKSMSQADKNRVGGSHLTNIDDGDIESVYSNGYGGDVYPVVNFSVPISRNYISLNTGFSALSNTIYLKETFGTMIVDEEFLERKFGDYEFAARRTRFDPRGVIITDYVADLILAKNKLFKFKSYYDILRDGVCLPNATVDPVIINGIIKTDYREKHKDLYDRVALGNLSINSLITNDSGAAALINDIYDKLGYCYTTNQNFIEDINSCDTTIFANTYLLSTSNKLTWSSNAGYIKCSSDSGSKRFTANSASNWRYTTTPPEIPDGARYIRVTHYPSIEKYFQVEDGKYGVGHATLAFNGGEPISAELMNFKSNTSLKANGSIYANQSKRYLSDYIEIPDGAVITDFCAIATETLAYCTFYDEDKCIISSETVNKYEMPERSIILSYDAYNSMFGTTYSSGDTEGFAPHTTTLLQFMFDDVDQENPLINETVTIIGLDSVNIASEDVFKLFQKNTYFEYALYMDGIDNLGNVLDLLSTSYKNQSAMIDGIYTMTTAVDVFVPIFELVAIFLYIGIIFILINFSSKMIKDKMHDIGILKALGTKNRAITAIFGLQVSLITILTCIMTTVGYYFFIDFANDVLLNSIKRFAPDRVVLDLDFLTFIPKIAIENCALVCILSIVTLVVPMIKIKSIKPVKIIKAKE